MKNLIEDVEIFKGTDGEKYIKVTHLQNIVYEFVRRVLKSGAVEIPKGREDYFKTINGEPTDIFNEFFKQ